MRTGITMIMICSFFAIFVITGAFKCGKRYLSEYCRNTTRVQINDLQCSNSSNAEENKDPPIPEDYSINFLRTEGEYFSSKTNTDPGISDGYFLVCQLEELRHKFKPDSRINDLIGLEEREKID